MHIHTQAPSYEGVVVKGKQIMVPTHFQPKLLELLHSNQMVIERKEALGMRITVLNKNE